ncbi:neuroglobin-like [Mercenaria mercenaria]|uniref:neuroglobin-like n=1 Tax=Mercenaria mercenaria TaxID=6596 RepID=UPI00234F8713|nr:neuroglobin-like [Mercenaria mercenaria]
MGCANSVTVLKTSCSNIKISQPKLTVTLAPQTGLTENEKRIIKSTWGYMAKDIPGNGLQVFLRIFETCPETKELFNVENIRHSELTRNQVIRGHGTRFMSAIGAAVNCLDESDDKQEKLREVLFVLGQQHKHYSGFKPEYFEIFYDALMWRWELCMRENFTPEVSDTWSHVFVYMMEKLKEGYSSKESQ